MLALPLSHCRCWHLLLNVFYFHLLLDQLGKANPRHSVTLVAVVFPFCRLLCSSAVALSVYLDK